MLNELRLIRKKVGKSIPCFLFVFFILLSTRILLLADMQVQLSLRPNQDIVYGDELASLDLFLSNRVSLENFSFEIIVSDPSFSFEKIDVLDGTTVLNLDSDDSNYRLNLKVDNSSSEQRKIATLYFKKNSIGYSDIKIDNVSANNGDGNLTVTPFVYSGLYAPNYANNAETYQNKPGDLGELAFSNPNPEDLTEPYQPDESIDSNFYPSQPERLDRTSDKIILVIIIIILIALIILFINLIKINRVKKKLKNSKKKSKSSGAKKTYKNK